MGDKAAGDDDMKDYVQSNWLLIIQSPPSECIVGRKQATQHFTLRQKWKQTKENHMNKPKRLERLLFKEDV